MTTVKRGDIVMITLTSGSMYVGIATTDDDSRFFDVVWYMGEQTGWYKSNAAAGKYITIIGQTPWFAEWDLDEHL